MSKQDVMDYVFETPHNTNPAILNQKLDELVKESGGHYEGGVVSSDEANKIKILSDGTMEVNSLSVDKILPSNKTTLIIYAIYNIPSTIVIIANATDSIIVHLFCFPSFVLPLFFSKKLFVDEPVIVDDSPASSFD